MGWQCKDEDFQKGSRKCVMLEPSSMVLLSFRARVNSGNRSLTLLPIQEHG